jgi:hypothetical protein
MIQEFRMNDLPAGINQTLGMCGTHRTLYQTYSAPAYSINQDTILTIGTQHVMEIENR